MRTRILLRLVLVVLPTVGLMLIWLAFLPRQGQASSPAAIIQPAGEQAPTHAPTPAVTPDPRWVEIVRQQEFNRGAAAMAAPPTINLNLTDGYLAGRVSYPSAVDIAILDQGVELGTWTVMPTPEGGSFLYMLSIYWDPGRILAGYELRVTQGAATSSMIIPTLTSLAYPQTDVLTGTAPASATLFAYLFPYADPGQVYTATATASSDGTYQMMWDPAVDLQPRDGGFLYSYQDPAQQSCVRFVAPFLSLQVGGIDLYGTAAPRSTAAVFVEDDTGIPLYSFYASTASDGFFSLNGCYARPDEGFVLSPTDRVIVEAGGQTFSMTVITLTAHADLPTGQVSGQAPASQPLEVLRFDGPVGMGEFCPGDLQPLNRVIVTATVDGGYTLTLPLAVGNYGTVLVTTPDGNQMYASFTVPYLEVNLGDPLDYYPYEWVLMWGQVNEPFAPITVEIQGPSGYLKDWYTLSALSNGYFSYHSYDAGVILESGDLLTLTTPHSPPISLFVPVLTAQVDAFNGIVTGQAPPFAQVVVSNGGGATLVVTADAEGHYSADFSSVGGLLGDSLGSVVWTSAEGYVVIRYFRTGPTSSCPPVLNQAQVGGNQVLISSNGLCGPFILRLRDAGGHAKYENLFETDPWGYLTLFDEDHRPIPILPGDQIEIEANGQVQVNVVPTLTINLDPFADQVFGQAPPFAEVSLSDPDWWRYFTTIANAQGGYMLDLSGSLDVDAGSTLRAGLEDTPYYYAYGTVPILQTHLYSSGVYGTLGPLTPYTITLSSQTAITTVMGYASGTGVYTALTYPPPGEFYGNPGERVEVETPTNFWEMIIPLLTARMDADAGLLSGQAPPASRLAIKLYDPGGGSLNTVITATTSGTYSVTFPVTPDRRFTSGIMTHFTAFDMRTDLSFNTPRWYITIGSVNVSGYAPIHGTPITFTLESGDGTFSQVLVQTLSTADFWLTFDRTIQPGDRLRMETEDGQVSEFTVPYLSAVHDYARQVLEGQVPTDGEVSVYIPSLYGGYTRHIRPSPDGHYGLDTSDLVPLVGAAGFIQYKDPYGTIVTRPYTILGYPAYLPLIGLPTAP
jgi:hypothetical protein